MQQVNGEDTMEEIHVILSRLDSRTEAHSQALTALRGDMTGSLKAIATNTDNMSTAIQQLTKDNNELMTNLINIVAKAWQVPVFMVFICTVGFVVYVLMGRASETHTDVHAGEYSISHGK